MLHQSREGKWVHAIRRGSGGVAFRSWEGFIKTCKEGNEAEIDNEGFEAWKPTPKEVSSGRLPN